jgi:zinc protease
MRSTRRIMPSVVQAVWRARSGVAVVLCAALWLIVVTAPPAQAAAIKPVRWVTKSGMVVLFIENHSLPTVHLQLLIKAGGTLDPKGREGTADLVASLLDEGTTSRTSQQIAEAVDFIGASLSAGAGPESSSISLSVLKKDLPTGMELFRDELLHPTFPEEELIRVRQRIIGSLIAEADEPEIVARKAWQELIYGPNPYHHPTEGYRDSLPSITRQELVEFHHRYYQPRLAIVAVVGDLTRKETEKLLSQFLGSWKNSDRERPPTNPVPNPMPPETKLIDKELTQATIVMGHLGISRDNPDFYAVSVMNYILGGGGFSSRLMKQIRDNEGLVYGISSGFHAMKQGGSFAVAMQTKNATANQAIEETRAVITRFQADGATQQELDEAKDFLIGSFPLRMDTSAKMVGLLTSLEFYDLGLGYLNDYPKKIAAVTLADVKRVATRYIHPDKMTMVVVAKQSAAKIAQPGAPAPPTPSAPSSPSAPSTGRP